MEHIVGSILGIDLGGQSDGLLVPFCPSEDDNLVIVQLKIGRIGSTQFNDQCNCIVELASPCQFDCARMRGNRLVACRDGRERQAETCPDQQNQLVTALC